MIYDIKYMGYSAYTIKYIKYIGFGTYPNQFKHIFYGFRTLLDIWFIYFPKSNPSTPPFYRHPISPSSQKPSPGTYPESTAALGYIDKILELPKTMAREPKILKKSSEYMFFGGGGDGENYFLIRSRIGFYKFKNWVLS